MSIQFHLTNPENKAEFFKLVSLNASSPVQRLEGYTILLITEGRGELYVSDQRLPFSPNTMLCLSPYEPFQISGEAGGYQLTFHPDFLCVYKHHAEVACNGVLFDNLYSPALALAGEDEMNRLLLVIDQMKNEFSGTGLAREEALVSLLKIFLIQAARIKLSLYPSDEKKWNESNPLVLLKLKEAVEKHFKEIHKAGSYAEMLNISTRALSRLTRSHFNKTLTDLIADRIFIEAKRELYLSSRSVKEIAYSLGFNDEFYFSRFFKKRANASPQRYRETIGFAKLEMV